MRVMPSILKELLQWEFRRDDAGLAHLRYRFDVVELRDWGSFNARGASFSPSSALASRRAAPPASPPPASSVPFAQQSPLQLLPFSRP